jgi:choline-sulfatase
VRITRETSVELLQRLAVHLVAGLVAAFALALVESVSAHGQAGFGIRSLGLFYLFGLMAPVGLGFGLLSAGISTLLSGVRWLAPLKQGAEGIFSSTPSPERFATVIAVASALVTLVLVVRGTEGAARDNLHAERIIRWVIALSSLAALGAGVIVAAFAQILLTPIARALGRGATPRNALALLTVVGLVLLLLRREAIESAIQGVVITPYLAPPVAVLLFLVAFWAAARVESRLALASSLAICSLLALVLTAATYGLSRDARQFVEGSTVTGQRLIRFYSRRFDSDHDGHASYFGGGDCDDTNARVHPNALDIEGDGIDSDCFGGDGAPDVEGILGDGHYDDVPEETRNASVLLILVDALRPDHLGIGGNERATSPRIDLFGRTAVIFDTAIAPSSRSVRSIPSAFTGLYPGQILYGPQYLYPAVKKENELIAEVFQDAGYRTEACMGTDYFSRVGDFFQGFDAVTQEGGNDRSVPTRCALEALPRLQASDDPFFLWTHVFNVHIPYLPDGQASRFGRYIDGPYDTEILLADQEIARILSEVDDDVIVILMSDHGEAFEEHGNRGHSTTLYEEEVRSTLMIRAPGFTPRRVEAPVTLADLSPTLRNLTGLPGRPIIAGRSLLPLMSGRTPQHWNERPLIMELLPDGMFPYDQKAIRVGDDKLIWWVRDGTTRFTNLRSDPTEDRDRWGDDPDRASELFDGLRAWAARARTSHDEGVDPHLLDSLPTPETALGYRFDEFEVLGYDPPEWRVERGETIRMTFYYLVEDPIDEDLMFFVSLRDASGGEFHDFHAHHYPVNGSHRTPQWRTGQLIKDEVEIVVPENVGTGDWTLSFSVRDSANWQPREFESDGHEVTHTILGEINVR